MLLWKKNGEANLRTHLAKKNKVKIPWLGGSTHRHSFYAVQVLSFISTAENVLCKISVSNEVFILNKTPGNNLIRNTFCFCGKPKGIVFIKHHSSMRQKWQPRQISSKNWKRNASLPRFYSFFLPNVKSIILRHQKRLIIPPPSTILSYTAVLKCFHCSIQLSETHYRPKSF